MWDDDEDDEHDGNVNCSKIAANGLSHQNPRPLVDEGRGGENAFDESLSVCLKKNFGYSTVKAFQRQAVRCALNGRNCFVIMATGAGKSLCYQIPPLMPSAAGRMSIVISPLISLMQDQVKALEKKNISATFLGSAQTASSSSIWNNISEGVYRLVYMSPEYAIGAIEILQRLQHKILLIAIDEAHCVSEWGHDFRPQYRQLSQLIQAFDTSSRISTICLTATATLAVQTDVMRHLQLSPHNTEVIRSSVNRRNIAYKVFDRKSIMSDLGGMLDLPKTTLPSQEAAKRAKVDIRNDSVNSYCSTLVYVNTKKEADDTARFLGSRGVRAAAYHADLSIAKRRSVQTEFLADIKQVVCATVAFGMGIDKPDIRRVINYGCPRSLEAYVQQSGRGGRDGEPTESVIFYSPSDESKAKQMILIDCQGPSHTQYLLELYGKMVGFVSARSCRREMILNYFEETCEADDDADDDGVKDIESFKRADMEGVCKRLRTEKGSYYSFCGKCDNCWRVAEKEASRQLSSPLTSSSVEAISPTSQKHDVTSDVFMLLKAVSDCKGRFGQTKPCEVLYGSKSVQDWLKKVPSYGVGSHHNLAWWKDFLKLLLKHNYLVEKVMTLGGGGPGRGRGRGGAAGGSYLAVQLTDESRRLLQSNRQSAPPILLALPPNLAPAPLKYRAITASGEESSERPTCVVVADEKVTATLRRQLMELRTRVARSLNQYPFNICPTLSLNSAATIRPSSAEMFYQHVEGITRACPAEFAEQAARLCLEFSGTHFLSKDNVTEHPGGAVTSISTTPDALLHSGIDKSRIPNGSTRQPTETVCTLSGTATSSTTFLGQFAFEAQQPTDSVATAGEASDAADKDNNVCALGRDNNGRQFKGNGADDDCKRPTAKLTRNRYHGAGENTDDLLPVDTGGWLLTKKRRLLPESMAGRTLTFDGTPAVSIVDRMHRQDHQPRDGSQSVSQEAEGQEANELISEDKMHAFAFMSPSQDFKTGKRPNWGKDDDDSGREKWISTSAVPVTENICNIVPALLRERSGTAGRGVDAGNEREGLELLTDGLEDLLCADDIEDILVNTEKESVKHDGSDERALLDGDERRTTGSSDEGQQRAERQAGGGEVSKEDDDVDEIEDDEHDELLNAL